MEALTRWSLRFPAATLGAVAIATLLMGAGLLRLETDVGYRAFLGADHPQVQTLDAFLERFGGGLPVIIAWSCERTPACESVFDPSALMMAYSVARSLAATPGVRRTESPATSALLVPDAQGFSVRRLVENGQPVGDRAALARRAWIDPFWRGALVSPDGMVGAILLELASSDSASSIRIFAELERVLAPYRTRGFTFHLVGGRVDFVVAAGELESATRRLIPVVVAAISIVVWLLFGSALGVGATLASTGLAALWTLGALGWLGWPQSTLTQTLPPLVLVVGTCDGIHLLARFASETAGGTGATRAARVRALERVSRDVGMPCVITTLTTAGGFLSFMASDLESFARFGVAAALGVIAALLLTFSLLPLLLATLPAARLPRSGATAAWDRALLALVAAAGRRSRSIVVVSLALALLGGLGFAQLRVDVSFEDLYGEQSRIVQWVRFVETHLRRPETIEIELRLPGGELAIDPAAIAQIERSSAFLESLDGLGPVHSILEPLSWIHRLVENDDPSYQRPAESRRKNAQLLALLTLDDPQRLSPWITLDQRRVRLSAEASKVPQERLSAWMKRIEAHVANDLPPEWGATVTGAGAVIHAMVNEIQSTQLRSFALAAAIDLLLVGLFLRSARWAALAMVPTALPVVLTLGTIGLLGVPLDVGTAMVATIVIGIAIDDTVHLLAQYRRRREAGLDRADSISKAVAHVGRAVITTSAALALGFLSLRASPWHSVASFGGVAAIAIVVALVADLVLLPALLLLGSAGRMLEGKTGPPTDSPDPGLRSTAVMSSRRSTRNG